MMDLFKTICRENDVDLLNLLLQYPGFDPAANENRALVMAAEHGHTEIVKILITDYRVDPSIPNNKALVRAAMNGHSEVVKILLQDERVDPTSNDYMSFVFAAMQKDYEMAKNLLTHKKTNYQDLILKLNDGHLKQYLDWLADAHYALQKALELQRKHDVM
jgi:ankyrin repeat protein